MTNELVFKALVDGYEKVAFTDQYIFGFEDRTNVWACFASTEVLPYVCTLDKASRGAGFALRFKPNKAQKELLKAGRTFVLCSKAFFESECASSKYNKGEVFEKMVTEYFGQTWVKDTVPFTEDGDLTLDGVAYQLKFQKATFCNEKSLQSLLQG